MSQELDNEISEEELKQLIEKAKENEIERRFILEIEDITDYSNFNWFVRHYQVIYGEVIEIVLKEKEEEYGNVLIRNIALIPKTAQVVIKIKEESDREEWNDVYFYVFLSTKGWIQVK